MFNMFMMGIISCALGVFLGILVAEHRWRSNAHTYLRIERNGKLYKVVQLGDQDSWNNLKMHE